MTCSYLQRAARLSPTQGDPEARAQSGQHSQYGCSRSGGSCEGRTQSPILAKTRALWLVSERRPAVERRNTDLPCF